MKKPLLVCLAGALTFACQPGTEEGAVSTSELGSPPTVARVDVPTHAAGVSLLRGYTPLFEQTTGDPCVAPGSGGALDVQVSGVSSRLDYMLVNSRADLAKALGIDLDVKIKYGLGSVEPSVKFLDDYKESSRSVFVLVTAAHSYKVTRAPGSRVDLLPEWASAAKDPAAFLPKCGSHFIDGITHGARLLLGLRFDVDTGDAMRDIEAGLGLGVNLGPVGVDASFGGKVKDTLTKTGARVTLTVASEGYLIEKDGHEVDATADAVKALIGDGFTDATINGLHGLMASMAESLKADLCRDAPGSTGCASGGPGYMANTSRRASVLSADLRPYASLPSAPSGQTWLAMTDMLTRVDGALRALSPLAARIEEAHENEIQRYLDASDAERARFGLASDTATVVDRSQLDAIASSWDDRLRPGSGSDARPLEELLQRCFASAAAGVFDVCDPKAKDGSEYQRAAAAFAKYQKEGRVLPLHYVPIAAMPLGSAEQQCASQHLRLPSRNEAAQMAVAVRSARDLATGGDLPRTIWHAGPSPWCTTFYNPPEAGTTKSSLDRCVDGKSVYEARLPSFCVGSEGPF